MGVCSDSSQTAKQLQMAVLKSLETISGIILIWLKPKSAAKLGSVGAIEMLYLKAI